MSVCFWEPFALGLQRGDMSIKNIVSNQLNQIRKYILIVLSISFILFVPAGTFAATSSSDLYNQRDSYSQQLQTARQQAEAKKQQAAYISEQVAQYNQQISAAQKSINQTQSSINSTQAKVTELKAQIADEEAKLQIEKNNLSNLIAEWYMEGGNQGLAMELISSDSLSDVVTRSRYYISIEEQINTSIEKINQLRDQLLSQKAAEDKQLANLTSLKNDQVAQRKVLDNASYIQKRLLSDTNSMISQLQAEQASAQKNLAAVQAKIDALSSTKTWGTQIVSSNDGSWYYSQTGNTTRLGSSPYTVSQYGCLITSIAMVATYYGQHVTPTDIAVVSSNFNYEGYLQVATPYPVSNIVVHYSQGVNWGVVNQELDAGHPVIVSIYLPSVGAINSDGSSHFIVLKSHDADKYYMHDPIYGQRGYDLSQVRSMKVIDAL